MKNIFLKMRMRPEVTFTFYAVKSLAKVPFSRIDKRAALFYNISCEFVSRRQGGDLLKNKKKAEGRAKVGKKFTKGGN